MKKMQYIILAQAGRKEVFPVQIVAGSAGLVARGVGLKFFLNEQTFIALGYNYLFLFNDVGNTADNGINSVRAGFGYAWGGDRTAPRSSN